MSIRVAVVGYGNIGKYAIEAVLAADDMELAGVVSRRARGGDFIEDVKVVRDITELDKPDVAILCTPSRSVEETALKCLALGISTVDSFDIHNMIFDLRETLAAEAVKHSAVSVISAGWDPGSDSVVRALMSMCAPKGITYTNFGPGMSMGHSVAARAIEGVEDALSLTIPLGTGIHRRMVYVKPKAGADFETIKKTLKADDYFSHDETHVMETDDIDALTDKGHAVRIERKAVSGSTDNQLFGFDMKINNPALTAQIMVACGRATMRLQPGAYTMPEVPVMDLLPGDRETLVKKLV